VQLPSASHATIRGQVAPKGGSAPAVESQAYLVRGDFVLSGDGYQKHTSAI
jgi:hypothetical protein